MCPRIIRTPARGRCPCLRVPVSVLASLYRFCRLLFPSVGENIVFSAELSPAGARGFRLSSRARGLAFRCPARLRGSCAARVVVVRFRVFRVGALLLGCRVVVWALVLARNCEKLPLGFVVGLFPLFFAVS